MREDRRQRAIRNELLTSGMYIVGSISGRRELYFAFPATPTITYPGCGPMGGSLSSCGVTEVFAQRILIWKTLLRELFIDNDGKRSKVRL